MARKSKGPKFYAVRKGRKSGIFLSWNECEAQTKGYSGAIFKSFSSKAEAEKFVGLDPSSSDLNTSKVDGYKNGCSQGSYGDDRNCTRNPGVTKKRKLETEKRILISADKVHESLRTFPPLHLSIVINFDGGSRGNPGIAGSGAYLQIKEGGSNESSKKQQTEKDPPHSKVQNYTEKDSIIKIRHFCGYKSTNNVAEYNGLLCGLKEASIIVKEYCAKLPKKENTIISVIVKGDSNLVCNQMLGLYACKHPNLKPIYAECKRLVSFIQSFSKASNSTDNSNIKIEISFEHVYREQNKISDALANEAMDARKSWKESSEIDDDADSSHQVSCTSGKHDGSGNNDQIDKVGSGELDIEEV